MNVVTRLFSSVFDDDVLSHGFVHSQIECQEEEEGKRNFITNSSAFTFTLLNRICLKGRSVVCAGRF